jgi:Zn-finger nucleic acid-binding protein
MKCPNCKNSTLESSYTLEKPISMHCTDCKGNWIRFQDYQEWQKSCHEEERAPDETYLPVLDSKQAKLCPDCGRILTKYRVHSSLNFHLDHCATCNGVWLDMNEWQALELNDLHCRMREFFSESWQKRLRADMTRDHLDRRYQEKLGRKDYERLKEVKVWMEENRNRDIILAFLMDENPYEI